MVHNFNHVLSSLLMVYKSVNNWVSNKLISIATYPLKMKSIPGQALASFSPSIPQGADSKNWNHSRETGNKWLWSSFMESKPKKLTIKIRASRTKSKTTIINICRNLIRVQQKSKPCLNHFPGQVRYSRAVNAQCRAFFFAVTKQIWRILHR